MKKRWLIALAASSLGGCGAPVEELPGQRRATALVWQEAYKAEAAPPVVEWRRDVCPRDASRTAVVWGGACYSGLYLRDDRALIAWRGSFVESAFAHELMHARQWLRGVDDPDHTVTEDWALVEAAQQNLRNAGF